MRCPRELRALLESVTDTDWRLAQCWHPVRRVREFPFPQGPVAVFIQDSVTRPRFGQWVVVREEIVLDPGESGAHVLTKYPRRGWLVTWIVQPCQPDDLVESQGRNRLRALRNAL